MQLAIRLLLDAPTIPLTNPSTATPDLLRERGEKEAPSAAQHLQGAEPIVDLGGRNGLCEDCLSLSLLLPVFGEL